MSCTLHQGEARCPATCKAPCRDLVRRSKRPDAAEALRSLAAEANGSALWTSTVPPFIMAVDGDGPKGARPRSGYHYLAPRFSH